MDRYNGSGIFWIGEQEEPFAMPFEKSPRLAIISGGSVIEPVRMSSLSRIGWHPSVWIDGSSGLLDTIARKTSPYKRIVEGPDWRSVANEFDAVIVALPHALHGSIGLALLEAGKHVFMEAPLAINGSEAQGMLTIASRDGLVLSAGLYRRYLHVAYWTKALLLSGVLGEVERFDLRESTVFSSGLSSEALFQPNVACGGVLTDAGVHALDLVLWWLGDFASVNYRDDSEGGFEANCILECALTSGARGRFELSRTRQLSNSIRIEGTRGFVEVGLHKNGVVAGSPNALAFRHDGISPPEMRPQFAAELLDTEMRDFRTRVSTSARAGISSSDVKSVELIERCYATRQRLIQPWVESLAAARSDGDLAVPALPRGSKVLVIGATGFVGGQLVERLVEARCAKICCIIRNVGRAARVARFPVELVGVDLRNADEIRRVVDGIDYVFHCAHDTGARRQNIEGLRNIIEACVGHSVRRLIYVSSCAVYEPFPDGPLTEETPNGDRSNVYVDTKLEMERMIFEASRNQGLPGTIVQPAIVYGPFCSPWTDAPAEKLIFGDVILPDRGEGLCNAVYIDDVVDSLILAAVSPAAIGERFLISGPQPVTWAAFFTEIACALGTNPPKFWPYHRIAQASLETFQNFIAAALDPKRLIRTVARWKPVRHVLQAGLDAMPDPLRMRMMRYYFDPGKHRDRQTFLPSREALVLYRTKAVVSTAKAQSRIGYRPQFDFQRGMMLTGRYLRWVYAGLGQSASIIRDADS